MRLLTLALIALTAIPATAQRGFDNSSGEHMLSTSGLPSGLDDHGMTITCWCRPDTSFGTDPILSVGYNGGTTDYNTMNSAEAVGNAGARMITVTTTNGTDTQDTSTQTTDGTIWYMYHGSWRSSSSRTIQRIKETSRTSAASGNSSTAMSNPSNAFDAISIGREADSTPANYMDGDVAFCAVWKTSQYDGPFGVAFGVTVAMGVSPTLIDPNNLVAYYELDETGATDAGIDLYGNDLTTTGTVSPITDGPPPVFYPTGGN